MAEKNVHMYPVSGVQVRVGTEYKVVVVHLPYITGFGTAQQQERQDHAYCLLPEQAALLRDSLTTALMQVGAG
jgi:hypothetical protein